MIYLAFTVYLLLILFTGMGIYKLWAGLLKPKVVNWILLPGTVVSEMAYIFGCLITGGEIRRAKLIDSSEGDSAKAAPATDATGGLKGIGPVVASLLAIVACGAAILILHAALGKPVMSVFHIIESKGYTAVTLPKDLMQSWPDFWEDLGRQSMLLRRMCETWATVKWSDWHVPVFIYASICLSVRLAPVRRPLRSTMLAVIAIAAVIALIGLLWKQFANLMDDVWPLLTYVWAMLLFLLVVSLLIRGAISLATALGKNSPAA